MNIGETELYKRNLFSNYWLFALIYIIFFLIHSPLLLQVKNLKEDLQKGKTCMTQHCLCFYSYCVLQLWIASVGCD